MSLSEQIRDVVNSLRSLNQPLLVEKLQTVQAAVVELEAELQRRQMRLDELEHRQNLRSNVVRRQAAYYESTPDGQLTDGPFCTRCLDVDHTKSRIGDMGAPYLECVICRTPYPRGEVQLDLQKEV